MSLIKYLTLIALLSTLFIHPMEDRIEQSVRVYFYNKNYSAARSLAKQLSSAKSKIWLDKIDAAEQGTFYVEPQAVATANCPPCPPVVCPPCVCPQVTPTEKISVEPTVQIAQAPTTPIEQVAQAPTTPTETVIKQEEVTPTVQPTPKGTPPVRQGTPPQKKPLAAKPTETVAEAQEIAPTVEPTTPTKQGAPPVKKGAPPTAPGKKGPPVTGKAAPPKVIKTTALAPVAKKEAPKTFEQEYPKPSSWQESVSTLDPTQQEAQKKLDLIAQTMLQKVQSGDQIKITDSIEYRGELAKLPEGNVKRFYTETEKKLTAAKPLVISKKELTPEQQKLKNLSAPTKTKLVKSIIAEYQKTMELFNKLDAPDIYWNNAQKGDVEIHVKVADWIFQYKQIVKNILLSLELAEPGSALEKIDLPIFEQRKRYALNNRTRLTTDKITSEKRAVPQQLLDATLPSSGTQTFALINPELLTEITVTEDDIKKSFTDLTTKKINDVKAKIILKNMIKTFNNSNPTQAETYNQEYQKLFNENPLL